MGILEVKEQNFWDKETVCETEEKIEGIALVKRELRRSWLSKVNPFTDPNNLIKRLELIILEKKQDMMVYMMSR